MKKNKIAYNIRVPKKFYQIIGFKYLLPKNISYIFR